jgi:hypothetical protein
MERIEIRWGGEKEGGGERELMTSINRDHNN